MPTEEDQVEDYRDTLERFETFTEDELRQVYEDPDPPPGDSDVGVVPG